MQQNSQPVLLQSQGKVAVITLNCPEQRNALSPALIQALLQNLEGCQENRQINAVVLTGTGKTFSIQNIVVRLLIESQEHKEPLSLQKILVVTFTRAATRDLKVRIRSNIEKALQ